MILSRPSARRSLPRASRRSTSAPSHAPDAAERSSGLPSAAGALVHGTIENGLVDGERLLGASGSLQRAAEAPPRPRRSRVGRSRAEPTFEHRDQLVETPQPFEGVGEPIGGLAVPRVGFQRAREEGDGVAVSRGVLEEGGRELHLQPVPIRARLQVGNRRLEQRRPTLHHHDARALVAERAMSRCERGPRGGVGQALVLELAVHPLGMAGDSGPHARVAGEVLRPDGGKVAEGARSSGQRGASLDAPLDRSREQVVAGARAERTLEATRVLPGLERRVDRRVHENRGPARRRPCARRPR